MSRNIKPNYLYALVVSLGAGCQHTDYRAEKLPPELQAPMVRSSQRLDLAHFSQPTIRSDIVHSGDVLLVSFATGLEDREGTNWRLRVNNDGFIDVPLVGLVRVAEMTLIGAEKVIHDASVEREIYRDPKVAVQLVKPKTNQVTVMGAVGRPGVYELPAMGSDLIAALTAAGGLDKDADTLVEIRLSARATNGQEPNKGYGVETVGFEKASEPATPGTNKIDLTKTDDAVNLRLSDGSVIMVPRKPPRTISVMGLVKNPREIETPQ